MSAHEVWGCLYYVFGISQDKGETCYFSLCNFALLNINRESQSTFGPGGPARSHRKALSHLAQWIRGSAEPNRLTVPCGRDNWVKQVVLCLTEVHEGNNMVWLWSRPLSRFCPGWVYLLSEEEDVQRLHPESLWMTEGYFRTCRTFGSHESDASVMLSTTRIKIYSL